MLTQTHTQYLGTRVPGSVSLDAGCPRAAEWEQGRQPRGWCCDSSAGEGAEIRAPLAVGHRRPLQTSEKPKRVTLF